MTHKFKGTDGTWVNRGTAIWAGDVYVAEVMSSREKDSVKLANAKLIASAPELLEALQGVMSMFPVIEDDKSGRLGFTLETRQKLNAAQKAIKKALGRK